MKAAEARSTALAAERDALGTRVFEIEKNADIYVAAVREEARERIAEAEQQRDALERLLADRNAELRRVRALYVDLVGGRRDEDEYAAPDAYEAEELHESQEPREAPRVRYVQAPQRATRPWRMPKPDELEKIADIAVRIGERLGLVEPDTADKKKTGLAASTINGHLTVRSTLMGCAVDWGLLDAVPKIRKLKVPPPEFDWLRPAEADRLLAVAAAEPKWSTLFTLALRAGLRRGELLALRWVDIDFAAPAVDVRRSVYRGRVGSTKGNRNRRLPLTADTVAALRRWRRRSPGPWVFPGPDGAVERCPKRINRALARLLDAVGLRTIRAGRGCTAAGRPAGPRQRSRTGHRQAQVPHCGAEACRAGFSPSRPALCRAGRAPP